MPDLKLLLALKLLYIGAIASFLWSDLENIYWRYRAPEMVESDSTSITSGSDRY